MIPLGLTTKQYKLLAQRIAAQGRLKDKYAELKEKPARKGEIFGKGGKGKKPKYTNRYTLTFTDEFKELVAKHKETLI